MSSAPSPHLSPWFDHAHPCALRRMMLNKDAATEYDHAVAIGGVASAVSKLADDTISKTSATFGIMGPHYFVIGPDGDLAWLTFSADEVIVSPPEAGQLLPAAISTQTPSGRCRFSVLASQKIRADDGRVWDPPDIGEDSGIDRIRAYDQRGAFALAVTFVNKPGVWVYREEWQPRWRRVTTVSAGALAEFAHDGDDLHLVWSDCDSANRPMISVRNLSEWDEDGERLERVFAHRIRDIAVVDTMVWACFGTDMLQGFDIVNMAFYASSASWCDALRHQCVTSLTPDGRDRILVGCADMSAVLMNAALTAAYSTFQPARYGVIEESLAAFKPDKETSKLLISSLQASIRAQNATLVKLVLPCISTFRRYQSLMSEVLLLACGTGNPSVVRYLLSKGVRPTEEHVYAAIDGCDSGYDVSDTITQLLMYLTPPELTPELYTFAIERMSTTMPFVYRRVANALMQKGARAPESAILQLCAAGFAPGDIELRRMQSSGAEINYRSRAYGGSAGQRALKWNDFFFLTTLINAGYVPDEADLLCLFKEHLPFEECYQWLWVIGLSADVERVAAEMTLRSYQQQAVRQLSRWWSPQDHHVYLPPVQDLVHTVLLIAQRLRSSMNPVLPQEMWYCILSQLSLHPKEFSSWRCVRDLTGASRQGIGLLLQNRACHQAKHMSQAPVGTFCPSASSRTRRCCPGGGSRAASWRRHTASLPNRPSTARRTRAPAA